MSGRPGDVRARLLAAERGRLRIARHGRLSIGVGYPNRYHVALSSLAFQWVVELAARVEGIGVARFVADPELAGRTLEEGRPLADLDLLAFSCSFELDAVNLLRVLDAAGIAARCEERRASDPLVVVGGPVAMINPLPLAPAVDVFCLGPAELLWTPLLEQALVTDDRAALLDELAARDGFFVPSRHLDRAGRPLARVRRARDGAVVHQIAAAIPASHVVTPLTEYRDRGLVEISRGCPERCRYCWISHASGRFTAYPYAALLERLDELGRLSPRVGLLATAVGDHPRLPAILEECCARGLEVAISSLRIPAMRPEILVPLARAGARSLTIAPEAGSDALRRRLNKPITGAEILEGARHAREAGIRRLKLYFVVGLPGEDDDDLEAIARLVAETRATLGPGGEIVAGVNLLVPKPFTPYHGEAMLSQAEARRRLGLLARRLRDLASVRLQRPSWREAVWQGYLGRASAEAFDALREAAAGRRLGRLLTDRRAEIEAAALSSRTPASHNLVVASTSAALWSGSAAGRPDAARDA